jgi:hypothetical protein
MPRIVISYRREDSGVITGRIFDRLVARYGRDAIFRDIDNVPFGVDFRTHIDQVLGASDVVLAVIGPQWAGPPASPSRLANAADPVRVEIETALRKGAPLIPVLVLGAAMPAGDQLPEGLKDFAYRNAVQLDAGQDFDVHMARLIRAVDGILGLTVEVARASAGETAAGLTPPQPPKNHRMLIGASIAAVFGMTVAAGWYVSLDRPRTVVPADTATVAPKVAPPPAASVPTAPSAPPVATAAPPSIDPEVLFWQTITTSNNSADFEEYLRKYPNGQFSGLARNRIVALTPPAPAPAPEVSRVIDCEGPFGRYSSHARLVQAFGQPNVEKGPIYLGEGEDTPGSIIYPNDPKNRIEITWKDITRLEKIKWIFVRKDSKWRLANGLSIGSSLEGVELLNGKPFKLTGFDWDYSGSVSSWQGGTLDTAFGDCIIRARFDPAANLPSRVTEKVSGDREFLSSNMDMRATRPRIYLLLIGYQ